MNIETKCRPNERGRAYGYAHLVYCDESKRIVVENVLVVVVSLVIPAR